MSLYTLPVSVSDLTQLQLGIECFTDVAEATNEAALINAGSDTVLSYANHLMASNISLSQVAMAVDSLMFGVTDTGAEFRSLSTQFLPAQVALANANGWIPTVYAAETLGLALAGGNGSSNAFATNFGSLSVAQFVAKTAALTGINTVAIEGFASYWLGFYAANPSAAFGLSVTLAAYGTAFGDAVGSALISPTADATTAVLTSQVQNALIDLAEHVFKTGIPLSAEPTHAPLQGEAGQIPDAGGFPLGSAINWALFDNVDYAQFVAPAQSGPLTITQAPTDFTLDTGHYGNSFAIGNVISAAGSGNLFTLILGDSTSGESFGGVTVDGYSTVNIVVNGFGNFLTHEFVENPPLGGNAGLVVSGGGFFLDLGNLAPGAGSEGIVSVSLGGAATIIDDGVHLNIGATDADRIDASNAPVLDMLAPADTYGTAGGVTVLGGTQPGNVLQGSLGPFLTYAAFANHSPGWVASYVGADKITSNSLNGGDTIYGDGGPDAITLPVNHAGSDTIVFGEDQMAGGNLTSHDVLAITGGSDQAYLGSWGVTGAPTAISSLFPGNTGGTSADMTTIAGFHAGFGGDGLEFIVQAWNGGSGVGSPTGDLTDLSGLYFALPGAARLSPAWVDSNTNGLLGNFENVLLYAPSGVPLLNAQQLAAELHTASGALRLVGNGFVPAGQDLHIIVAYDASFTLYYNNQSTFVVQTKIADVDLVNTSASNQSSTDHVNVYASDIVNLPGVALTGLASDNIHFI